MTDRQDPKAPKTGAPKTAAILIIGNEILSGRTADTNTGWIASRLGGRGIAVAEVRIVPDREEAVVEAVLALKDRADYLLTTGGIGPTHDDITAACIARAFGVGLEVHAGARAALLKYYGSEESLTPARLKMATLPQGAALIDNPVSGAPGFSIGNVYVMAGVPSIMKAMLENVLPLLWSGMPLLSRAVSCPLPESFIARPLAQMQERLEGIEIGSYPHFSEGRPGLTLVLRGADPAALDAAAGELARMLTADLGADPAGVSVSGG